MRKKLDEAQEQALCFDYQICGMTPLELSLKYGIATNTIWNILVRNNIPRTNKSQKKG